MKNKEISHFFNEEYTQQAQYINFSKIASVISGSKVTQQKILSTVMSENISSWQKVEVISSMTALKTLYLGGSSNIDGVATNLGSGYVGANNVVLVETKGDFGGRLDTTAAASRYIFMKKGLQFDHYFNKEDLNILPKYTFEGQEIEYQYFTYTLPMVLVNGTKGLGSGYSSDILPRSEEDITKYLIYNLEGKNKTNKPFQNKPHFNGFKGVVKQSDAKNKWIIEGTFDRINNTTIAITEVPIGETRKSYIKKLDALELNGVIKSYEDLCDPKKDIFLFKVKTEFAFSKNTDEEILKKLKLITKKTENYTLNDEDNKIIVFKDVNEIFWYYYKFKLNTLSERKKYLEEKMKQDIIIDISKYTFIEAIVNDKLIINKRKKNDIVKDLNTFDKIVKRDNSFDYLLNMSIQSLTEERMKNLMKDIKSKNVELKKLQSKTLEKMWLEDLK